MQKLDTASDVVCLLTERSLERPRILYEAGVAKGKLDTSVFGVAIGIPLSKVSNGPFYQFQKGPRILERMIARCIDAKRDVKE